MVLRPVLQECIEILLMKQNEESLECLCLLLKTVGKELENYKKSSEEKEVFLFGINSFLIKLIYFKFF